MTALRIVVDEVVVAVCGECENFNARFNRNREVRTPAPTSLPYRDGDPARRWRKRAGVRTSRMRIAKTTSQFFVLIAEPWIRD